MTWKAIARSAIGTRHAASGVPCQDCGNVLIFDDIVIGAVSDGAGSARYAEIGSDVAVSTVLKQLAKSLQWLRVQKCFGTSALKVPFSHKRARKIFSIALEATLKSLRKKAQHLGCPLDELACTLIAFLATPDWFAAVQIGDGFIAFRIPGEEYKLLFQPDKGEFANTTTFVVSTHFRMQIGIVTGSPQFICAATDGLERAAIRFADWTLSQGFFSPLETYLRHEYKSPDTCKVASLLSNKLNSKTDDDKTLVLCVLE